MCGYVSVESGRFEEMCGNLGGRNHGGKTMLLFALGLYGKVAEEERLQTRS